jgi:serine/threonine protein kinase
MPEELLAGQLIDRRYQIRKMIGKGGFGRTYLAVDTKQFDHPCVLKEFAPTGDSEFVIQKSYELFRQEAATLYGLDHPQIPKFYGLLEDDDRLFIVQDYVDGKSYWDLLQNYRQQNRRFTEAEITQWLQDLLPVLDYIHSRNIVHRDISPDNVLLPNGKNQPVLIDFGVVKQVETEMTGVGSNVNPPSIVGKLGYAPVEQIRMGKCSPSSDLYSLGVTAVVLLTGQDDPNYLIDSNLEWQWESLALVSDRLTAILNKMLADRPQQRYQSAQEVLLDLSGHETVHFVASSTPTASPKTSIPPVTLMSRLPVNAHTTLVSPAQPLPAKVSTRSPISPIKKRAVVAALMVLAVGGLGISAQSGQIPGLCQQLNNCAKDKAAQDDYQQAVEQAKSGEALSKSAKTLKDVQAARDRLKAATEALKAIPSDTKIHGDAQKKLKSTHETLAQVQTHLDQETKASTTLSKAQKDGQAAEQKVKTAQTIASYDAAIGLWQGAIVMLQKLPAQSFVKTQANEVITAYESKIADANQQISLLSPAPQPAPSIAANANSSNSEAQSASPAGAASSYEPAPSYEPPPARDEPLWSGDGGGNSGGGQSSPGGAPLW